MEENGTIVDERYALNCKIVMDGKRTDFEWNGG